MKSRSPSGPFLVIKSFWNSRNIRRLTNRWRSARLQHLHCVINGVTSVLHQANEIIYGETRFTTVQIKTYFWWVIYIVKSPCSLLDNGPWLQMCEKDALTQMREVQLFCNLLHNMLNMQLKLHSPICSHCGYYTCGKISMFKPTNVL